MLTCSNLNWHLVKVKRHKFAYINFLTKNCNIPVVSANVYHRKVYNDHDERMCITCDVLGDEYHVVIECQTNNDIRSKYLPPHYR